MWNLGATGLHDASHAAVRAVRFVEAGTPGNARARSRGRELELDRTASEAGDLLAGLLDLRADALAHLLSWPPSLMKTDPRF
ncbi:MAG: hypothetical protein H0T42_33660 [Deltaproteobacteria bacterium]|nr:hypothetical protein [Deltaproteobacteria bacterium]